MIHNKRNYTGTEKQYFKTLLEEITPCFIDNNKAFFLECYQLQYTPKDAIKQFREVNKIYLK